MLLQICFQVKSEYNEWVEQACFDYTEAVVRLNELWNLCHVPDVERNIAREFNPSKWSLFRLQWLSREHGDEIKQTIYMVGANLLTGGWGHINL